MSDLLSKPVIGISLGDPLGIGPEIIVKALADKHVRKAARLIVYGINDLLVQTAERLGIEPDWGRVPVDSQLVRNGHVAAGLWPAVVVDLDQFAGTTTSVPRRPQPTEFGGKVSLKSVNCAIDAALLPHDDPGRIDALVTAPISKTSWHLAGLKRFPGHTELLANRTRAKRHVMMFVAPQMRIALATIHLPLMDVRNVLTIGRVFDPIDLVAEACRERFGVANPRIAVCGLNPHASEGGMFGDEEHRLIEPAIRLAVEVGIDATGPYPADTVFLQALEGRFDAVVAMYHDQGAIPIKLLSRNEAVNVTLGLPIIRTSPDHGTAFDIAGTNQAEAGSMIAAIRLAARMLASSSQRATQRPPGRHRQRHENTPN